MRRPLRIALAAAFVAASVSCASTTGQAPAEPVVAPGDAPTSWVGLDYPLLRFTLSDADEQVLQDGIRALAITCLKRFGISTVPKRITAVSMRSSVFQRRFGTDDPEQVARYGYGRAPGADSSAIEKKSESAMDQFDEVQTGVDSHGQPSKLTDSSGDPVPQGGCQQEAWLRISGGASSYQAPEVVLDLAGQAYSRVLNDSRFREAAEEWSACMKRAGYSFGQRWDAGNSVASAPAATQLAMARLDMACAQEVNYVGRAFQIDSAYEEMLITGNEGTLRAVLSQNQAIMSNAKRALAGR